MVVGRQVSGRPWPWRVSMEIWVGRIVLAAIMGFILGVSTDRSISTTRTYAITCMAVSYALLRAHEPRVDLVCRQLLAKQKIIRTCR